jgi:hypothetical protein
MTVNDKVVSILEGVCPDCKGDLQAVEVSGTRYWLLHVCLFPTADVKVREWNGNGNGNRSDESTIGCIIQQCDDCGQRFEAYAHRSGDWSM